MKEVKANNIKSLIYRARNGEEEAFEIIYEQFYTPIFRYLYFRIKDKDEAKDLSQIVFLKIFKSLKNLENREINPIAYFLIITKNTLIDYSRKRKNILLPNEEIKGIGDKTDNYFEKKEINEIIRFAIKTLSEAQQEIIVLKFINELDNREISEITNKTEETIRQLQSRGLRKLRKYFEENNIL